MLILPRLVLGLFLLGGFAQDGDLTVGSELKLVLRDRSVVRGKLTGVDGPLLKLLTPLGTRIRINRGDVAQFVVSEPPAPLKPPTTAPDNDRSSPTRPTVAPTTVPREVVIRRYELSDHGDLVSEFDIVAHHRHGSEPLEEYRFLATGKILEVVDPHAGRLRFSETAIGSLNRCKVDLSAPLGAGENARLRVRMLERRYLDWRCSNPTLTIHQRFDRAIDLQIQLHHPEGMELVESSLTPERLEPGQTSFRSQLQAGDKLQLKLRLRR